MPYTHLLHVCQDKQRIVALSMTRQGEYQVFLPRRDYPLEEQWPHYAEIRELLDVWLARRIGKPIMIGPRQDVEVQPGEDRYPRAIAQAISKSPLYIWAYTTQTFLWISTAQIGAAMGHKADAKFRTYLEEQGLQLHRSASGHHTARLGQVSHILGTDVADRVLLQPYQVAGFLGVSSYSAGNICRRLGIAVDRGRLEGVTMAPWGKVRRIKRTGLRSFEIE
jgi:hypothetical protein